MKPGDTRKQNLQWAVIGLVACAWLYWIYPTPWEQMKLEYSVIRINRFTGEKQYLSDRGWGKYSPPAASSVVSSAIPVTGLPPVPQNRDLTTGEIAKLDGKLTIAPGGFLKGDLYNGNDFTVKNVVILVTITNSDGALVKSREYKLADYPKMSPLSSKSVLEEAGLSLESGQKWSWSITKAQVDALASSP